MPHLNFAVKLLLLTGLLTVAAVPRASAQGNCDRACLTGFLDGWFKGLVSNSTSGMPVAKDVKITQNGQIATLAATFWDSADSVPYPARSRSQSRRNRRLHRASSQTNGTPEYHPADLLPDTQRFENGLQTTGFVRNGAYVSAAAGFDAGRFIGRNLWDRRYPVVDEERGIVLSMVRFLKDGQKSQSTATSNSRIVAEFFSVKRGLIQEVHAVLFNVPDTLPTQWPADYGPGRGGAGW
jgi:hypothetical protein